MAPLSATEAPASVPHHLASNPFLDLSGVDISKFSNPYDALLEATHHDPQKLQDRYATHRSTRNLQQRAKLLDPAFEGVIIDPILEKLENPDKYPGYVDPRHCLVFWARPEPHIKKLIEEVQRRIKCVAPNLWLMPANNLHITVLEITHSKTEEEITALREKVAPVLDDIMTHASRLASKPKLIKPLVGFDASALALSFVPAASEKDAFSYHALRRDVFSMASGAGVKVDSRYVVPSAHLTIGRFITRDDFAKEDGSVDQEKMEKLVETIEDVNEWLEKENWQEGGEGEWKVGDGDPGMLLRYGTVWYGGGSTVAETKK